MVASMRFTLRRETMKLMGLLRKKMRWRLRTNRSAWRLCSVVLSVAFAVFGLGLICLGTLAWLSPHPAPLKLSRGQSAELPPSPWLNAGVTLFSSPTREGVPPDAESLGCTMLAGGAESPLGRSQGPEPRGTRVQENVSLFPVIELGRIGRGQRLTCAGDHLVHGVAWVLPTEASRSAAGMSVVIAGIGSIGMSLLLNPRARGFAAR